MTDPLKVPSSLLNALETGLKVRAEGKEEGRIYKLASGEYGFLSAQQAKTQRATEVPFRELAKIFTSVRNESGDLQIILKLQIVQRPGNVMDKTNVLFGKMTGSEKNTQKVTAGEGSSSSKPAHLQHQMDILSRHPERNRAVSSEYTKDHIAKNNDLGELYKIRDGCATLRTEKLSFGQQLALGSIQGAVEARIKTVEQQVKHEKLQEKVSAGIERTIDPKDRKETLGKTVDFLCDKYKITPSDIKKEAMLLGTNAETAKLKMVLRLTTYLEADFGAAVPSPSLAARKEMTGYELPTIKLIEKQFKTAVRDNSFGSEKTLEKDLGMVVFGNKVIILGEVKGKGSFKVAKAASSYFEMTGPEEQGAFVTLAPKPKKTDEVEKNGSTEESESQESRDTTESSSGTTKDSSGTTQISYGTTQMSSGTTQMSSGTTQMSSGTTQMSSGTTEISSGTTEVKVKKRAPQDMKALFANIIASDNKPQREKKEVTIHDDFRFVELADMEELLSKTESEPDKQKLRYLIDKRTSDIEQMENYKAGSEEAEYNREIEITKALQGEYCIKLHSVIDLKVGSKMMVQEAAGYVFPEKEGVREEKKVVDFEQIQEMKKNGQLSPQEKKQFEGMLSQGFAGVLDLHNKGYIHRDLKEQNFLVTKNGKGVLSDFGSVVKESGDPMKSEYIGTPIYSSPEACGSAGTEFWDNITNKTDVWSCGIIVFESLVKSGEQRHPMEFGGGLHPLVLMARKKGYVDDVELQQQYEESYKEPENKNSFEHLVWEATRINPDNRPTMLEFCRKFDAIRNAEVVQE